MAGQATIKPALAAIDNDFRQRLESHFAFSFAVDELPAPFPAPTLILAGRQDSICGYREAWKLLDHFPRATFALLDRAGHGLSFEHPVLFRALVSDTDFVWNVVMWANMPEPEGPGEFPSVLPIRRSVDATARFFATTPQPKLVSEWLDRVEEYAQARKKSMESCGQVNRPAEDFGNHP